MKQLLYEIKQWVITKIILFLMDGEIVKNFLQELAKKNADIVANKKHVQENTRNIHAKSREFSERLHKIERLYNMAINLKPEYAGSGSWAVVVIDGNPEYIKFIRLGRRDMMDIARFLRQFDTGRRPPTIDGPLDMPKDFFYHDLGRNEDGSR